jgi:hypothetical protein
MASYETDGVELVDAWEQGEGRDIVTDKPTHAGVVREYRIEVQSEAEDILMDAVVYAGSQGWSIQEDMTSSVLFNGSKHLPPGEGRLRLALGAADPLEAPDGPRVLTLLLDFGLVLSGDPTNVTTRQPIARPENHPCYPYSPQYAFHSSGLV